MNAEPLKVRLVSHASLIIETPDCRIWTDPWLFGRAFNDSWALLGPVAFEEEWLAGIDYLWISHEHPDHFHLPTLASLPASFCERVTVLFQQNNSDKMFEAFRKLGFPRHRALPHRQVVALTNETRVYCYQAVPMDSALAVLAGGQCVLDVNDVELNRRDCATIAGDVGQADVVLNQFSIAGYAGLTDRDRHLPELAARVVDTVIANHRDLGAGLTVPIASFVYFCRDDNRYVNAYANKPDAVADRLVAEGLGARVMFPGDELTVGLAENDAPARARWSGVYADLDSLAYEGPGHVAREEVEAAFRECSSLLGERYPRWLLRRLGEVTVRVADLGVTLRFNLARGTIVEVAGSPDVEVNSQPLQLVFARPFGMQTLGVSARLRVYRSTRSWRLHRILFSMWNAEVYLRPRYLFTAANWRFLRSHLSGGLNQIAHRLSLMR
jgi:UDP-MurNAc hydroxylase